MAEVQLDGVVGLDLGEACGRFLYPVGDDAHGADALLAELVHHPLQLGDDVALDWIQRYGGDAEHQILHEHKKDDGQQLPALEHGQHKRVANKSAELLALGRDHRDDLRR